jgi:dTDP-glucose 4,6-dehydratase
MKSILIFGSNSFTGSHLVHHCLKNGYKVIGISRSDEYPSVMLPYLYKGNENLNFSFFKLDLNKDLNNILKICDDNKPEIIANFAAQGEVRTSWDFPVQWYETNTLAVVRLTDELRKRDYLKKYVHVSTPESYGNTSNNIKETQCYNPSTPYAASKLAGDMHLLTLHKRYNFPVVLTRSSNVYGVHQQLYRIIPRTIIYLRMKKKIQLHGNGKTQRSFLHVRDVANATLKIAERGVNGDVYHISPKHSYTSPEEDHVSIYSVVKTICEMMNYDFKSSVDLVDQNFGQDSNYSINSSKLRSELNWKPNISLHTGIKEMIEWIDNNWSQIINLPLEYIHKR